MIDVNVKAVQILTKLFLREFAGKDKGYILNVASIAGFLPGPLMSTYYATKSYVVALTKSLYGELKAKKANVYVGALCPGPVETEFDSIANVQFSLKGISPKYVARYGTEKMFKKKVIIIPGILSQIAVFFSKFLPLNLLSSVVFSNQRKKVFKK